VADEKQNLRAVLSEARSSLSAECARALSMRVQQRLLATPAYLTATRIVLYAPLGREVETALIAADAIRSGRQLFYPIVDRKRRRITLGAVSSLGSEIETAVARMKPDQR